MTKTYALRGLGSISGAFFGAALIDLLPIALRALPGALGLPIASATIDHLTYIVTGALIVVFLIAEPAGLAALWDRGRAYAFRTFRAGGWDAREHPTSGFIQQ